MFLGEAKLVQPGYTLIVIASALSVVGTVALLARKERIRKFAYENAEDE